MCGLAVAALVGCGGQDPAGPVDESNPFLDDQGSDDKADTSYMNPDGIEVELDLEADVTAPSYRLADGPAELGQFALTYLRKRGEIYLESLAEDSASTGRAEWLVDGDWVAGDKVEGIPETKLKHFRIRGVNAVLLFAAAKGAVEGQVFPTKVPQKPFDLMVEAGDTCADPDSHMSLGASVYWYLWNPERPGCKAPVQDMKVTISKMMPAAPKVYPEYDRLIADNKITAVVLFGQIGDGAITDSDPGMRGLKQMASWLTQARFTEVTPAPLGRRFTKVVKGITFEFDLYSPNEFSGLGDFGHFANFQKALSEHEIVVYDGHSMLGASDFWSRPTYPDFYQIFLYGGCLGYEYYVRPILAGKKGWQNVDILSSVVEVSADANQFAAPILAKLVYTVQHGYGASWRDLLVAVRRSVGDSTFGVSGVRDNCFSPTGSLCQP